MSYYNTEENNNINMLIHNKKREYIFPKNYDVKPKFLGIFEYDFIFVLSVLILITYFILGALKVPILIKLEIMISVFLPVILIVASTVNGESLLYKVKYFISFYMKEKVYIYLKDYKHK